MNVTFKHFEGYVVSKVLVSDSAVAKELIFSCSILRQITTFEVWQDGSLIGEYKDLQSAINIYNEI